MKKNGVLVIALFSLFLSNFAMELTGQNRFPGAGILFDTRVVPRIDITIPQASLDSILQPGNERNDKEYMAIFRFTNDETTVEIDSVGFRLRGNTSRKSAKKSFKVSLNTFIVGQKFDGVEKINMNGEHNDPSISRAYLSWYLFRKAEVPGSRSNHVQFYINDEYKGVYLNVEHIDEEFVDLRFGNNAGNLYKCLWPADMIFKGTDADLYKFEDSGRRAYELKTNLQLDDYADLAEFISVLNNAPADELPDKLNRIFNVNTYLKNLAVEVLIGHWDAYSFNKNNYYLYFNDGTKKFEFIPYDPDNTFGISWFGEDWTDRNIYNWQSEWEYRPMYERILEIQKYRDRYSFYLQELLDHYFNDVHLDTLLDNVRSRIAGFASYDPYRGLDYGYDYDAFYNSFETAAGDHVRRGIKPFITERAASALQQLELNAIDPIITLLFATTPDPGEFAEVEFQVEDDGQIGNVEIWFSTDDNFYTRPLIQKGDGIYGANHPGLADESGELKFYIVATDDEMNTTRDPSSGYYSISYGGELSSPDTHHRMDITIYPNPVHSALFVDAADGVYSYFRILDVSGRSLQEGTFVKHAGIVFSDVIPDGTYILELSNATSTRIPKAYATFIKLNLK
ncbi:CotH kinase family protein [Bacteroidota bacterium]